MKPLSFVRFTGRPESTALNRRTLSPVRAASNMRWANSIVSDGSCCTSWVSACKWLGCFEKEYLQCYTDHLNLEMLYIVSSGSDRHYTNRFRVGWQITAQIPKNSTIIASILFFLGDSNSLIILLGVPWSILLFSNLTVAFGASCTLAVRSQPEWISCEMSNLRLLENHRCCFLR